MKALLRKELVQILPAQVFVALAQAVVIAWGVPPKAILLPTDLSMATAYACWTLVVIVEGVLVGLVQFRRERSAGTEPYLVHRGTGSTKAFVAKAMSAAMALAVLVLVPPLIYALWHVRLFPGVEHPLTERIGHCAALGACSLPAYAIGALVAQFRRGWVVRSLIALLGVATLFFIETLASYTPQDVASTPSAPFVALQPVLAVAVLALAHLLFRAGDDERRPWPGRVGVAASIAAVLLSWIPWIGLVATSQQVARLQLFESYPQVVEGEHRTLYTVQRIKRPDPEIPNAVVSENEFRDARGQVVALDRAREYDRFAFELDPFLTLFDPPTTWLSETEPSRIIERPVWQRAGPFGFDGAWIRLTHSSEFPWNRWLRVSDGAVYCVGHDRADAGVLAADILNRPDTGKPFSDRTLVLYGIDGIGEALLIDREDSTLWRMPGLGELAIQAVPLPGGDRLVDIERLHPRHLARAGLLRRSGSIESLLFLGSKGTYVWNHGTLRAFTEAPAPYLATHVGEVFEPADAARWVLESHLGAAAVWRLEPSQVDGLGFRLEVFDAQSGELALAHDYRPESTEQKGWAALAWVMSLARSPAGALWSHFAAAVEPRNATRLLSYSSVRDPLLLGGARPGLLAACLAVGVVLATFAHRRPGRDPRDRTVRRTWILAILLLGLPAWMLFRLLEPSRKALLVRSQPAGARTQLLIDSPRSTPVLKPALSGV